MMDNSRALIKALENWAKRVTTGYKDVNVRDLSSSFRDGLAFCAIIHHYRPDLIDFESLSKENILENNSLAFKVAEKQLGVPALLDAEDMVAYEHPDRLSVITYLSQLRNCFENQNKVNKMKPDLKRLQKSASGPPTKVSVTGTPTAAKRYEVCQSCKHPVFIIERLIVDGKLYHTTCFRCHKCNSLLNPGAYVDSDTDGLYECTVCPKDEKADSAESSMDISEEVHDSKLDDYIISTPKIERVAEKEFISRGAVEFAKNNLFQETENGSKESPRNSTSLSNSNLDAESEPRIRAKSSISVKDKISVFERNQVHRKSFDPQISKSLKPSAVHSSNLNTSFSSLPNSISLSDKQKPISDTKNSSEIEHISLKTTGTNNQDISVNNADAVKTEIIDKKKSSDKKNSISNAEFAYNNGDAIKTEIIDEKKISDIKSSTSKAEIVDDNRCETLKSDVTFKENATSKTINTLEKLKSESSPLSSRDIFSTSLQPLKLNLTPNKRDFNNLRQSSFSSVKNINVPEIKSSYVSPLLQLKTDTRLKRFNSENRISTFDFISNKSSDNQNQHTTARRSSFESNQNNNSSTPNTLTVKPHAKSFPRTHSAHEMGSLLQTNTHLTEISNSDLLHSTNKLNDSTKTENSISSIEFKSLPTAPLLNEEIKEKDSQVPALSSSIIKPDSLTGVDEPDIKCDNSLKTPEIIVPNLKIEEVKEEDYPDDLNPFGDEEDTEKDYPDDLNPFADDDDDKVQDVSSNVSIDDYDDSKNPFASGDDDDDQIETIPKTPPSQRTLSYENKTPTFHNSVSSNLSSPSDSLKGTLKKRKAPQPPKLSDIFPRESTDSELNVSSNSPITSPLVHKKTLTSSPKIRKNKPAPPPPKPPSMDSAADVKMTKENNNMKLKSESSTHKTDLSSPSKKKKRPAPPVPIPMRKDAKKIPLKEIIREMKEIEEKQREYEKQGREIELLIRDKDKDEEPSVEEEEYIMQLFELVNRKNALFRRQAELMYIKRSQRLEEQQQEIEKQIRLLMEKPENEKTDDDKAKEEELTMELIDIVDQRNSIIDSIEMDRRRELEEDTSVKEQIEIKNGELPIAAEIKQKSKKKKEKKSKEKKEKKKKEEQESGKGTIKRKLFKRP